MSAATKLQRVSVDDYLAEELVSTIKHEYLGGTVYAMPGGRNVHNRIATNISGSFFARLPNGPCLPYNSDTKIRVRLPTHVRFYYPDASIICRPNPPDDSFQDKPAVIAEVISKSTRRIDEGKKKDFYLMIGSLSVYLLVESTCPAVTLYRRTEQGFICETYSGLDAVIPLSEIGIELPLAEVYRGVEFAPEIEEEAE